jgi:hypothetical protein
VRKVAPGRCLISLYEFVRGGETAGADPRDETSKPGEILRRGPGDEKLGEIEQWITDGRNLPVDDPGHLPLVAEENVSDVVVTVKNPDVPFWWPVRRKPSL